MNLTLRLLGVPASVFTSLFLVGAAALAADDSPSTPPPTKGVDKESPASAEEIPKLNLLEAVRAGSVSVNAEGLGDGRMTLSVTNKTKRKLQVVLPPGLIASGATGQFGGMGGMGGGMGGMGGGMGGGMMGGMGGGGMGGMGGGMGGMGGGGMGGMGGGGMGGGMGGGGGTMPASMGMMMLGRLIMSLVGDRDSWDQQSLMSGMMGGMGGGMGGMGGGMGGMGGGMGGMGGGMRSVPPTSLPFATLNPKQTRHLPTRLVGLSNPNPEQPVVMPAKGERLQLGDISQLTVDPRVQKALKRLAEDKAPQSVSQLVMWRVVQHMDWATITAMSKNWANAQELTLAQAFADQLAELPKGDSGTINCEVRADNSMHKALARQLEKALKDQTVLGLAVKTEIPAQPEGPGVACRITLRGTAEKPEAIVEMSTSNPDASAWAAAGKFTLPVALETEKAKTDAFVDSLAEGMLGRLVRASVAPASKGKGKDMYRVRIENGSPLILNGIAVVGTGSESGQEPKVLAGISVAPGKSITVPASSRVVEQLGLKKGVRLVAADLSGL